MTTSATPPQTVRRLDPPSQDQDDRLRSAAVDRLSASGYLLLRRVRCDVAGGVVTLSGAVPSFHLKQVAHAVLMNVEDVQRVNNLLEVR